MTHMGLSGCQPSPGEHSAPAAYHEARPLGVQPTLEPKPEKPCRDLGLRDLGFRDLGFRVRGI